MRINKRQSDPAASRSPCHKGVPLSWHTPKAPCPPNARTLFLQHGRQPHIPSHPDAHGQPPTLTARDAVLLQNLFALGRSLFALASHHDLPLPDLVDWLSQPHIQSARDLIARELAEGLKSEALEILRQIARTSEDPVERRRATTQILRALNPPQPRRPRPDAPPSPPNGTAHSSKPASVQRTPTVREGPPSPSDDLGSATSDAINQLAAAEAFRSEVLTTYGPSLDQALDADLDDKDETAGVAERLQGQCNPSRGRDPIAPLRARRLADDRRCPRPQPIHNQRGAAAGPAGVQCI